MGCDPYLGIGADVLYLGVMALYYTFDDRGTAGILVLILVVDIPIIHFSVQW